MTLFEQVKEITDKGGEIRFGDIDNNNIFLFRITLGEWNTQGALSASTLRDDHLCFLVQEKWLEIIELNKSTDEQIQDMTRAHREEEKT